MGRSSGLYLDDELFAYAESCAKKFHRGKLNAFISSLVAAHREQHAEAMGGEPILALAKQHGYSHLEELKELLHHPKDDPSNPIDQVTVMNRFYDALRNALKSGVVATEVGFELSPNRQYLQVVMEEVKNSFIELASERPELFGAKPQQGSPVKYKQVPKAKPKLAPRNESKAE